MLPKSLFQSIGGFDSRLYSPPITKTTDLAFSRYERPDSKCFINRSARCSISKERTGGTDISHWHEEASGKLTERRSQAKWKEALATKTSQRRRLLRWEPNSRKGINVFLVIDNSLPHGRTGTPVRFRMFSDPHDSSLILGHRVSFIPDNLQQHPAIWRMN